MPEQNKTEWKEIKDGDMDKFEGPISNLFDLANEKVMMTTDLYPQFYTRERVANSMKGAIGRVGSFRIILDSHVSVDSLRSQMPWLFGNAKVEIEQSDEPIPHWMAIDGRHFRFEKPHAANTPGRSNFIILNADKDEKIRPMIAEAVEILDNMWEDSESVK